MYVCICLYNYIHMSAIHMSAIHNLQCIGTSAQEISVALNREQSGTHPHTSFTYMYKKVVGNISFVL